jgi:hypothetical protein
VELVEVANTGMCVLLLVGSPSGLLSVRSIEGMRHNSDSRGVNLIRGPYLA